MSVGSGQGIFFNAGVSTHGIPENFYGQQKKSTIFLIFSKRTKKRPAYGGERSFISFRLKLGLGALIGFCCIQEGAERERKWKCPSLRPIQGFS